MKSLGLKFSVKAVITFILKLKTERLFSISPSLVRLEFTYKMKSGKVNFHDYAAATWSTRRKLDDRNSE